MSLDLEGRVDVTLIRAEGALSSVRVCSSRPQLAQRLLAGRRPDDAAAVVGALFSLCGKAQRLACQGACAAAVAAPSPDRGARLPVLIEMGLEHAWRLLLDWPQVAGSAGPGGVSADPRVLAQLRRASARPDHLADRLVEVVSGLLGEPPDKWLERGADALERWCASSVAPAARLLAGERKADIGAEPRLPLIPSLSGLADEALAAMAVQALAEPGFCARPRWRGGPAETGALARQAGHPMITGWTARRGLGAGARFLARLVELASMPRWLVGDAPPVIRVLGLGEGTGVAAVETARGLLIHVARLDRGRIGEYRIIAPTDWSCADDGPLAAELSVLAPGPGLERRARLLMTAIDPCVVCGLEVRDA